MIEKVFIVDEDVKSREFLYELIFGAGFSVVTIPRGKEALERLKKDRAQLIILEDTPGEFSGVALAQKIREFDQEAKIILLGEDPKTEDQIPQLKAVGISAYLKKDFQDSSLIKSIFSILKQQGISSFSKGKTFGRILIVDDELESREMVGNYLKRRGFEAEMATSGEECLEKVKQGSFDVVLLDITMSGMDGLLTLKRIRDFNKHTKVLMVSALHHKDVLDEARAMGATDYIVKPFNLETLDLKLSEILLSQYEKLS